MRIEDRGSRIEDRGSRGEGRVARGEPDAALLRLTGKNLRAK
ncbi:MAG: hypothetical protein NUW37_13340 [Planctomycetes bacterium]|nr:hypothetical protein [Planctomycetota bacterium]